MENNRNIKIMNMHQFKPVHSYDVRVDRLSVLGNKNYMHDESKRDRVCELYNDEFEELYRIDKRVQKELQRIRGILLKQGQLRLFCWCFPKRCHVETIRNHLLQKG